jgi:gamma-glutamyltranspeptidase/glutathione hydrolase
MRPLVMAKNCVVSSGHYLASQAGLEMFHKGGNAIDAGVAAGISLGLLYFHFVNFGGVAPISIYLAREKRVLTISGLGRWPRAATLEYFRDHEKGIPAGVKRTVIPAAPDAWCMALQRYGTLSFGDVIEPTLRLCEEGFPVYPWLSEFIEKNRKLLLRWKTNADLFAPQGKPLTTGDLFINKDLGRTLRRLAAAEDAAKHLGRSAGIQAARDEFYKGDIAAEMVRFCQSEGGFMTAKDLEEFSVQEEAPVSTTFRDLEFYACGPWCQGPVVPMTLNLLEGYDLGAIGHNSADYIHTVNSALTLAFSDRHHFFGDPEFVDVPIEGLLAKDYAAKRRSIIERQRIFSVMPPPGDPWAYQTNGSPQDGAVHVPAAFDAPRQPDTSYVCAADAEGNLFSATPSDGARETPVIPGLGFIMSSRGVQSAIDGSIPMHIAPWKRPRLTPNPAIVLKGGKPFMALGTPGGDVQPQAMIQVLFNLVLFGMSPQEAVEQPRFAGWTFPDTHWPHPYTPGRLNVDDRVPAAELRKLTALGYTVVPWKYLDYRAGSVCIAMRVVEKGLLAAAADPRRVSYAIGF